MKPADLRTAALDHLAIPRRLDWWVRMDSNHRANEDLVYSQAHSTALPHTHQLVPPARLERATSGFVDRRSDSTELRRHETGAAGGPRTPDARLFKPALFRLSYRGNDLAPRAGFEPALPTRQAGTLPLS
jgi:hypothetical protein